MSETAINNVNNTRSKNKSQSNNLRPKDSPVTSSSEIIEETKEIKENNHNSSLNIQEDFVDVIVIFLPKYEKEFIPNVRVLVRENGDVDFCELLKTLKTMCFPIENNMISYYSYSSDMYVYCGNDPVPPNSYIPVREIAPSGDTRQITIRVRQVQTNMPVASEPIVDKESIKIESSEGNSANTPRQKRTKERKIGEILDKVLQWRRLYTGVNDPTTGQIVKMSLEESAQRVGIAKKSLDDYLLQIRFGKKHGFNFNDQYGERVGVLRTFVKKYKNKAPEKSDDDNNDLSQELENLIEKKDKGKDMKKDTTINHRSKKIQK